jgi:hypothetical protein
MKFFLGGETPAPESRGGLNPALQNRRPAGHVGDGKISSVDFRKRFWRWLAIVAVFVIAAIAAVIGAIKPSSNAKLTELNNIQELQTRFNQDSGKVRLLLLLSPT